MRKILLLLTIVPLSLLAQSIPSMDTSFATFGRVSLSVWNNNYANCTAVQPDKKIIVGGMIQQNTPTTRQSYILARYNENGILDSTFGSNGLLYNDISNSGNIYDIKVMPDGKIIIAGRWNNGAFIGRLLANGSFDTSFGTNGVTEFTGSYIRDVEILSDGTIVGYGQKNTESLLVKLNLNGQNDSTFGNNGIVSTNFGYPSLINNAMVRQSDGKFIITGAVVPNSSYPQNNQVFVAQYTANGILDLTFGTNGIILYNNDVKVGRDIAVTPSGKILVLAEKPDAIITSIGTTSLFYLLQFNIDGTLDMTFNNLGYTGFGPTYCSSVKVDSQNKIYIGSLHFNSTSYYYFRQVIRLNADGSKDTSFGNAGIYNSNTRVYPSEYVYGNNNMNFAPDGKLVLGSYVNTPSFSITIMRLNISPTNLSLSENIVKSENISIYPNPVKDFINIKSKNDILLLELTDISGRSITKKIKETRLDLQMVPAGTFILKVKTTHEEESFKVIKR